MTRPTFALTLRAEPRPSDAFDPAAELRLRLALKHLLRAFGLRAVTLKARSVSEGSTPPPKAAAAPGEGPRVDRPPPQRAARYRQPLLF